MSWLDNLDEDLSKNDHRSDARGTRNNNDRSAKTCQKTGRQKPKRQNNDRSPMTNRRINRQNQIGIIAKKPSNRQAAKQRPINKSKIDAEPTCTSVTKVKKIKIDEFSFAMQSKICKAPSAHQQKSDSTDIKESGIKKRVIKPVDTDAVALFADKVTIAGLPEAYNAKVKGSRIMFRIALIFAMSMIVYKTRQIALQYLMQESVFVDLPMNYRAPFPNVSICQQTDYLNGDMIEQWMVPERWRRRMEKFNFTIKDIRHNIIDSQRWGFDGDFGSPIFLVTSALFRAAAEEAKKNGKTVWEIFWPSCSETLSNCAFDNQPFDCCQAATTLPMLTTSCIQIRGDWLPKTLTDSIFRDPLRKEEAGLTFDVSTNWSRGQIGWGADDGYHIFVDELPSLFKVPVNVPSGMDVLLNLAQPQRFELKTDCVPNEETPQLKHFSDYDANGIQCQSESLLSVGENHLGCTFPILSHGPANGTCLFEAWNIANLILNYGGYTVQTAQVLPAESSRVKRSSGVTMDAAETESYDSTKAFYSKDSPCKPLCSRWTYPVFSTSYGSIQYRDRDLEKNRLANRSWSRVRIILPSSSFSHKEEPRLSSYLALCDIGGMMGVYAGFSMITYAQILAYGFYVFWCQLKIICKTSLLGKR